MAFHKFFQSAIADKAIGIYGDGKQTRDFTFISDAVAANLAAAVVPEAVGEVFNIGGGSRVVLLDVLDTMEKVIGKPIERSHQGLARGDARHTAADVTKVPGSTPGYTTFNINPLLYLFQRRIIVIV